MRHIPEGMLRRIDDEPLAVPDRAIEHLDGCERCRERHEQISADRDRAARLLSAPRPVPGDVDAAWARFERELRATSAAARAQDRPHVTAGRRAFPRVSVRTALAVAAVGIVVAGTAAAATLTTIFAPTHVAPVTVSQSDLRAIAALTGLGDGRLLSGFATPTGSTTLRFGTVTWSSRPAAPAGSRAQATAEAGFALPLPGRLPAAVSAAPQFFVAPRARATIAFNSRAAALAHSSVTIDAGPAVVIRYDATTTPGVPVLAVASLRRPTAQSSNASTSQIEAFLLHQPGIPPQLAEEVRLLGDLQTTLPVPVPAGAVTRSVRVGGRDAVLLTDAGNAAAAILWEDAQGLVHAVVGLVDAQDVLNVARQIGAAGR